MDRALTAMDKEQPMAEGEMFEGLEDFDHEQYEDEGRERWGRTDAYKESMRRTRRYTRDDWTRIKAEAEDVMARLSALLEEGAQAASGAARELAEEHRCHIDRWFYPCSHRMHAGLADMYVADQRFAEHFEKRGEGLAAFFREAILANAARRGNAS